MKRLLALFLALLCVLSLVGCDPGTNSLDGNELLKNTVKIELYDYENENPKILDLSGKKQPAFHFSNATLLAELDPLLVKDFVRDIAAQGYLYFGSALNEPLGKTIVLHQEDGTMVVLYGCVYKRKNRLDRYYGDCNIYDADGVFVKHIGDVNASYIEALASEYFEVNEPT